MTRSLITHKYGSTLLTIWEPLCTNESLPLWSPRLFAPGVNTRTGYEMTQLIRQICTTSLGSGPFAVVISAPVQSTQASPSDQHLKVSDNGSQVYSPIMGRDIHLGDRAGPSVAKATDSSSSTLIETQPRRYTVWSVSTHSALHSSPLCAFL